MHPEGQGSKMGEIFGIHEWETVYVSPSSQEVFKQEQYEDWLWEVATYMYDRMPVREQRLTSINDLIAALRAVKYRWNRVRRCMDCGEIVKDNEIAGHQCATNTTLTKVAKGPTFMRRVKN